MRRQLGLAAAVVMTTAFVTAVAGHAEATAGTPAATEAPAATKAPAGTKTPAATKAAAPATTFGVPRIVDPIHTYGEPDIKVAPNGDIHVSGPAGTGVQRSIWNVSKDGGDSWRGGEGNPPPPPPPTPPPLGERTGGAG